MGLIGRYFLACVVCVSMLLCGSFTVSRRRLLLHPSLLSPRLSSSRGLSSLQSRVDRHLSLLQDTINDQKLRLSASDHNELSSSLNPVWLPRLDRMKRPEARALIPALSADNSLGFVPANGQPPTKSSLTYYVMQQKKLHPEKVLLVRVGEFYEAYGVDALMLIEHCGLNPMAGRARAGCPIKNIQSTLDGLTRSVSVVNGRTDGGPGLTVAVYEESGDFLSNEKQSTSKGRIKSRFLSQIVSPASSTYLYDIGARHQHAIEFKENRPVVGIIKTTSGYSASFTRVDEKTVRVHDRLTVEALRSLLEQNGFTEPLFLHDSVSGNVAADFKGVNARPSINKGNCVILPFLSRDQAVEVERIKGYCGPISSHSESSFHNLVLKRVSSYLDIAKTDFRFMYCDGDVNEDMSDSSSVRRRVKQPLPVYTSTALQIGLVENPHVPRLLPHLLAEGYPAYAGRYLSHMLLNPPPYYIADHMQKLLHVLMASPSDSAKDLPLCPPISIGKVVSLLSARQANAATFREIASNLKGVANMLRSESPLIPHILAIASYDSGISMSSDHLLKQLEKAYGIIENTIALNETLLGSSTDVPHRDKNLRIPDDFFYRNEIEARGSISIDSDSLTQELYSDMDTTALSLCEAVQNEFPKSGVDVVFDINNNIICFQKSKRKRSSVQNPDEPENYEYHHPLDRSYTPLARKYTTKGVEEALKKYLTSVDNMKRHVQSKLIQLCSQMVDIPANENTTIELSASYVGSIVQAAHLAVLFNTAIYHSYSAKRLNWTLPTLDPVESVQKVVPGDGLIMGLKSLTPYWLDRSTAVKNDVAMDGMLLLTAPNMSGKSTLMRATLVAALLANCGLCIPAGADSHVPRYDCFFLRTSSFDIPSEGKSAFGLEMDDMRVILRDSTAASLVMIDEIGKGTSSRDGAAIAGALLEHLDKNNVSGIFATHLHELLSLPLHTHKMRRGRMGVLFPNRKTDGLSRPQWTYLLEEGVCTDSMAISTARQFGLPQSVVRRAEALGGHFSDNYLPENSNSEDHFESAIDTTAKSSVKSLLKDSLQNYISTLNIPLKDNSFYSVVNVPHGSISPPFLEGKSCVYVLDIEGSWGGEEEHIYYIGESEVFSKRLSTHRRALEGPDAFVNPLIAKGAPQTKGTSRSHSHRIGAYCVPVRNKSEARYLESHLISTFKLHGLDIRKDADEAHKHFGSLSI